MLHLSLNNGKCKVSMAIKAFIFYRSFYRSVVCHSYFLSTGYTSSVHSCAGVKQIGKRIYIYVVLRVTYGKEFLSNQTY